jgi:hypothetical protein
MRVRSAGFEIVKSRYFDIAGIIPWFVFIKLFRSSVTSGRAGLYDRVVVPLIRRIETYITPPIGKNVMVVGEKRTA